MSTGQATGVLKIPGPQRAPEEFWIDFGPSQLKPALAEWPSGWHDSPPAQGVRDEPCGNDAWNDAGNETNMGADGLYWDHQFSSAGAAAAGYQRIQDAVRGCAGTTTSTVTTPDGSTVFTARGDRDLWAVQHDDYVMVTYLPRATTTPPEHVSRAIGSAMLRAIDDGVAAYQKGD